MSGLSLKNVFKIYAGNIRAVTDFNLKVSDKEFFVLLGPKDSGKSTVLRMIAGLEDITEGSLYFGDTLHNDIGLKHRDIAVVFQNYMLKPHKTVYDNMAFGLRLRKFPEAEIADRVRETADILGISDLLNNKLKTLPVIQHLRTAFGRAIVRSSRVILFDEPLKNLDADLRVQMRSEIVELHKKLATTFIYATRDQEEAMAIGTRIAVMKDGYIQQTGTQKDLYDEPCNIFIASYIGKPQINLINSVISGGDGFLYVGLYGQKLRLPKNISNRIGESAIGKELIVGIRPEDIRYVKSNIIKSPEAVISASIDKIEESAEKRFLYIKIPDTDEYMIAQAETGMQHRSGETVNLEIDTNRLHFFDPETELAL